MTQTLTAETEPVEQRTEHPHITRIEGVAVVRGSRIPVRIIAQMYRAGDMVEDILHTYPHLSASAVHDAISFYLDHGTEIEQEIAAHRIENVLKRHNAQMDGRGFITFAPAGTNG
jgi:uncharacterized protein (DUF433 family)